MCLFNENPIIAGFMYKTNIHDQNLVKGNKNHQAPIVPPINFPSQLLL